MLHILWAAASYLVFITRSREEGCDVLHTVNDLTNLTVTLWPHSTYCAPVSCKILDQNILLPWYHAANSKHFSACYILCEAYLFLVFYIYKVMFPAPLKQTAEYGPFTKLPIRSIFLSGSIPGVVDVWLRLIFWGCYGSVAHQHVT